MSQLSDPAYLLNQQYRDGSNLRARIELHERFSVNPQGWHPWLFGYLDLPTDARILEVGAGVGKLWRENLDRIPAGWHITLTDMSPGMLAEAQANLAKTRPFAFQQVDAQAIPFADASFDAVIANHMLYHVPDRPRALAEIRRVLKPDGRLYASTVGEAHLREMDDLIRRWHPGPRQRGMPFTLENGATQLQAIFPHVERYDYEDALVVTEAEPLIAYILSSSFSGEVFDGPTLAELIETVNREITSHGRFYITKSGGLFVAWGEK